MKIRLEQHIQNRCFLGQDVETHKPVYVYVRTTVNQKTIGQLLGTVINAETSPQGEVWEVQYEAV